MTGWFEKVHSEAVPRQYESSRLNIDYTITSKRKLRKLVEGGYVNGWDDPRMPTVVGMRRRGFTHKAYVTSVSVLVCRSQMVLLMLQCLNTASVSL